MIFSRSYNDHKCHLFKLFDFLSYRKRDSSYVFDYVSDHCFPFRYFMYLITMEYDLTDGLDARTTSMPEVIDNAQPADY